MNVVDTSGWLEYFADGPNADDFSVPLKDVKNLIVPTISIYMEGVKYLPKKTHEINSFVTILFFKKSQQHRCLPSRVGAKHLPN